MNYFDNSNIKLDILKKKAYNLRWAEVADGTIPLTAADMDYPCAPAIKQALLAYVEEAISPIHRNWACLRLIRHFQIM
ncbi:hypothetical protein MKA57_07095 [[Clostridium] innocuum]|nr:hypothetical protein [[Clostridium] innocuum]